MLWRNRVKLGVFVAIFITLAGVLIWAVSLHLKHMQVLLLGMAVMLYFIPVSLSYAASFIAVRLLESIFSARGGIVQIVLAGCLPALLPAILMHNEQDMPRYVLGMFPGGLLGAAIAFWPETPGETSARIEPTF
jgi:hypothetical protein